MTALRRIALLSGCAGVALVGAPPAASAHGIGGRADLPVPVSWFAIGAGVVIVITFLMLSAMWSEPRLQSGPRQRARPSPGLSRLIGVLRTVGLVALAAVLVAGFADGAASPLNIAPVTVFVLFWLVVPFAGAVIGDWWHWLNPWSTLSGWINRRRPERSDLLARWGVWPATAVFVWFTWLELVAPGSGEPRTLATAALVYTALMIAGGYLAGPNTGLRLFEAFHTYNQLTAAIAPFDLVPERDGPGTATANQRTGVGRRGWLRALPVLPEWPGLAAFVIAMIGTVTYDGLSSTDWWADAFPELRREVWFGTLALIAVVVVFGAVYAMASAAAARLAGGGWTTRRVAARFAHTLVPIGLAYAVAHYATLVLYEGQLAIIAASDPLGRGWDLFGTAEWSVSFFLSPEAVWYLQVVTIVAGHVAGVVLAHDRALADFGTEVAVRTQYAMLALMVALTSVGLFVLAG
jgi:hypothetical protein